jgi:hypothetical protein
MMIETYLAIVTDDFVLTEEIRVDLREKGMEVLEYYPKLGVVKFQKLENFRLENFPFLISMEEDQFFSSQEE